jgi:hypothetical protein
MQPLSARLGRPGAEGVEHPQGEEREGGDDAQEADSLEQPLYDSGQEKRGDNAERDAGKSQASGPHRLDEGRHWNADGLEDGNGQQAKGRESGHRSGEKKHIREGTGDED